MFNNYQQNFDENFKEIFFNTYTFSNNDNNILFYCCKKVFILMNDWEKRNETSLPKKRRLLQSLKYGRFY